LAGKPISRQRPGRSIAWTPPPGRRTGGRRTPGARPPPRPRTAACSASATAGFGASSSAPAAQSGMSPCQSSTARRRPTEAPCTCRGATAPCRATTPPRAAVPGGRPPAIPNRPPRRPSPTARCMSAPIASFRARGPWSSWTSPMEPSCGPARSPATPTTPRPWLVKTSTSPTAGRLPASRPRTGRWCGPTRRPPPTSTASAPRRPLPTAISISGGSNPSSSASAWASPTGPRPRSRSRGRRM
jgi:hypothetical protein